jgi:hypothetical protein
MPETNSDDDIEYHDVESEGNGHGWEDEGNGHEGEYEVNGPEVGHEGGGRIPLPIDPNNTQHLFRDATWSKSNNTYSPKPMPYSGGEAGLKNEFTCMPIYLCLFGFFWTYTVMHRICIETNRYARMVEDGKPRGGHDWYDVDEGELRAFMAVRL